MTVVNREEPRQVYGDIIDLPHHRSDQHPPMRLSDRAAQFSPFAALTGYEDMVREEARQTGARQTLSETDREAMDRKLARLAAVLAEKRFPEITADYFLPDLRKAGGRYEEVTGVVKRLDPVERCLVLFAANGVSDGQHLDLDRIDALRGDLFDGMDEGLEAP